MTARKAALSLHESVPNDPDEQAGDTSPDESPEVVFTPSPKLEVSVTTAAEQAAADAEAKRGYRIGKWAGLPNYECLTCPFASTEEMAIDLHVAEHRVQRWGVPAWTGLVDEQGNPIMRLAEED